MAKKPKHPDQKFELESALVTRLLEALGLSGVLSDPKKTYGRETGADVEVRLAARTKTAIAIRACLQ